MAPIDYYILYLRIITENKRNIFLFQTEISEKWNNMAFSFLIGSECRVKGLNIIFRYNKNLIEFNRPNTACLKQTYCFVGKLFECNQ